MSAVQPSTPSAEPTQPPTGPVTGRSWFTKGRIVALALVLSIASTGASYAFSLTPAGQRADRTVEAVSDHLDAGFEAADDAIERALPD